MRFEVCFLLFLFLLLLSFLGLSSFVSLLARKGLTRTLGGTGYWSVWTTASVLVCDSHTGVLTWR